MKIEDVFSKLEHFVDVSDPDISLPNYFHGIQTAEAIRNDGHPDWLQLVGLIHDLGKVLFTFDEPDYAVVGDTFVVGCKLPPSMVFYEHTEEHPDYDNSVLGIYERSCGLDNLHLSISMPGLIIIESNFFFG